MAFKPIENLKGFSASTPPFVIFTLCILFFAIALISLGSYIKNNDVPDYDINYDWNTLLMGLSELEFCLLANETQAAITTTTTSSSVNVTSTPSATTSGDIFEEAEGLSLHNASLTMGVSFRAHATAHMEMHMGTTHLYSRFAPAEAGIEDGGGQMYLTFELQQPLKNPDCSHSGCTSETFDACLTIIGPQNVFPKTRRPKICNSTMEVTKPEKLTKMRIKPASLDDPVAWCNEGTVAKAIHQYDPKLTVMLSSAERSIINLHLMYTSYFLFVMLVTCVCYALVKGPPLKHRTISHSIANEKKISAPI